MTNFASLFKTKTGTCDEVACRYMAGLLTEAPRKNMERMDEHLGAKDYEALQHFLSSSPWDSRPVYSAIAKRANGRIGGRPGSVVIVDEAAHGKKGDKSAGVARQHNGRLGKTDNCQVGVYIALHAGEHTAIIGSELFLPKEWIKDPERCRKAGIPQSRIDEGDLTKVTIAKRLIEQAIADGVEFECVVADAFYGRDSSFRLFLKEKGLTYCVDIASSTRLFGQKPRQRSRPKLITLATRSAEEIAVEMVKKAKGRQTIHLREGENGLVVAEVWVKRVWDWPADEEAPMEVWLVVRKMPDGKLKLSLCNAPEAVPAKRLALWQAGRFYIERAFQDAKSHVGMGQYQARGWRAWHHHMAMVSLALLFLMEERLINPMEKPLLSARDIVELLNWAFTKDRTEQEMLDRLMRRHAQRQRNAINAQARARVAAGLPDPRKRKSGRKSSRK